MLFATQRERGNFRYSLKINSLANGNFEVLIVMVAISGPDRAIEQVFKPPIVAASETDAQNLGIEWSKIWIDSQS
ncbi:hypothetical protein LT85_2783 [Collimonas arenae]|uniref:Uncharacterized protein n=1 Tax=Collimonas arenae TaxID=279058 RepID=A0A0A1FBM8_9BURK|nr:hypothetical protein [Collimonas arenae]AIY41941.1 hypothetical protein LT85_2783 [Collimonas arenae]